MQSLLETAGTAISLKYVALVGHFGSYPSALMARNEHLHLISKLRSTPSGVTGKRREGPCFIRRTQLWTVLL
ncbi:MAG TPA: hypothetical protein VF313_12655 [Anaerolineaceae bacterium]